jgi:predicted metal-binding membrane protein
MGASGSPSTTAARTGTTPSWPGRRSTVTQAIDSVPEGRRISSRAVAVSLAAAALATWVVVIDRMRGMDGGPGTALGGLGWYVGVWVTMMAAMMLPSVAPTVMVFARVHRQRAARGQTFVPTWIFVAGYFGAWTAYGLVAYGVYRGIVALDLGFLEWDEQGPILAGTAIGLAGLYQVTPLKRICLKHCRTPLHFVVHAWREGRLGAFWMGLEHGAYCVGCCLGLMLILFALGVMSLLWMAVVAALVFAEKVLPGGQRVSLALAVVFVTLAVWVAAAPGSVPGLTDPASDMMMAP